MMGHQHQPGCKLGSSMQLKYIIDAALTCNNT
uniref:Uncharacterized protein n=1 Tax=Setaria italica TaxID=4555 RepID=K3ZGA6_SETIT